MSRKTNLIEPTIEAMRKAWEARKDLYLRPTRDSMVIEGDGWMKIVDYDTEHPSGLLAVHVVKKNGETSEVFLDESSWVGAR